MRRQIPHGNRWRTTEPAGNASTRQLYPGLAIAMPKSEYRRDHPTACYVGTRGRPWRTTSICQYADRDRSGRWRMSERKAVQRRDRAGASSLTVRISGLRFSSSAAY